VLLKLEFSRHIFKNAQILNLTKIRPVTAQLFHADRRTDMTRLVDAFCNFVNGTKSTFANKNSLLVSSIIMLINVPQVADR
jgi:hypothetical protein